MEYLGYKLENSLHAEKHNALLACRELRTSLFRISFIASGSLTLGATGYTRIKKGKANIHDEPPASEIEQSSSGEDQQSGNGSLNEDLVSPPSKPNPRKGKLIKSFHNSPKSIFHS